MKNTLIIPTFLMMCQVNLSSQHTTDIVVLGAYQAETTDWSELNKVFTEKSSWLLNNLILTKLGETPVKASNIKFDYNILSKERMERIQNESPETVNICMLGNSITEGGNWNKLTGGKYIKNCGQGGYTTGQMFWHMDSTVIAANPEYCFVMGGINDFSVGLDIEVVYENYIEILTRLTEAGIKPVVQSTLYQEKHSPNNPLVTELNERLQLYCHQHNNPFLNVNKVLSKDNGLLEKYTTDGTHLNSSGYKTWAALLTGFFKTQNIKF